MTGRRRSPGWGTAGLAGDGRARILLTFADQAVSSASNFVTGVVIARLSGAAEFGEYALALTVWLIVVGLHRALITEPVIIVGRDLDDAEAPVARGVSAELLLGGAVAVVVGLAGGLAAAAGSRIGILLLAMAPWFPALLVQDYWRAMAFRRRQPGLALLDDLVFAGVQLGCIAIAVQLGWRSAPWVITAWGVGATAGALAGLGWFPAVAGLHHGLALFRELWTFSRWMLADFVSQFGSEQAYIAFAALLLTRTEYGGFRAAFSLLGPAYVIALACGNVGLPGASRLAGGSERHALRQYARRLSTGTVACLALYGAAVAVAGERVLDAVYGPEFARYAPIATLGVFAYAAQGVVFGKGIALRAARQVRLLWRVRAGVAAGSLSALVLLVTWLGTTGAGWAAVATACLLVVAMVTVYRRELGGPGARPPGTEATTAEGDVPPVLVVEPGAPPTAWGPAP